MELLALLLRLIAPLLAPLPVLAAPATAPELPCPAAGATLAADVAIYAGTAGGVVSAVAARRMMGAAARIAIVNPTAHLGGMVSGGLGSTDGRDSGGIAHEFFQRAGGYKFAPSAAERVFDGWARNSTLLVAHHCEAVAAQTQGGAAVRTRPVSRRDRFGRPCGASP